ncbi:unnamed protein product [Fraxinus pennsylvanica]|uniref:RING-type domain-containing protein n=1 Tax=Fraxinus pennsylvanica TaxID=56036 RepID=A0AAD2AF46_9LAMI|nr:unnamed protein product [Fraxinus pennsylvanica]
MAGDLEWNVADSVRMGMVGDFTCDAQLGRVGRVFKLGRPDSSSGEAPPAQPMLVLEELDKDVLCQRCMQIIKDAILTACGHSFCYICIVTHLHNKSDCPCCSHHLTTNHLYPNFLLDKLLMKISARQIAKIANPLEKLRHTIEQGYDVSVKELETLLSLLSEKKSKMEQEEAVTNLQTLPDFLLCLKKRRLDELIEAAFTSKQRFSLAVSYTLASTNFQGTSENSKTDAKTTASHLIPRKDASGGSDSQNITQSSLTMASALLPLHHLVNEQQQRDSPGLNRESCSAGDVEFSECCVDFSQVLLFKREQKFEPDLSAQLRPLCLVEGLPILCLKISFNCCSIEFDRDDELFATAGVSRRIKVFEFSSVKVWCTEQEASVLNIDVKANICSVQYNPGSSIHVAVGSADHNIHYFDLRNLSKPLHIFNVHRKAVSYVNFLSNNELASASTDSTLRLWDVKENVQLRTFRGHANEKNFVGLTVNSEYIACGSKTNEVFVYHKAISKPATCHRFSSDTDEADEDAGSFFISALCWKSESLTMLTANSQGTIKVLALAPYQ